MKKFTKLINESVESMTWGELVAQGDIDFINCDAEYLNDFVFGSVKYNYKDELISKSERHELTNNITVYDIHTFYNTYQFILICKNSDPLAITRVYDQHGFTNFKNIVVVYGHEEIVFYDCDDFTHKKIHTR